MAIFQVTHKQLWYLQEVRNVFYYETVTGNPSVSEWIDIADEIRDDYDTLAKLRRVPDWEFYAIDYRIVDTPGLLTFEALPTSGNLVGTNAGDSLATQVALLVSVKGTTVKPNRARSYLPGYGDDQLIDSIFPGSTLTNAESFIDEQSVLNAAGTNELQRVAAAWNETHTAVTSHNNIAGDASFGSQVPATQRRRRIGVGI